MTKSQEKKKSNNRKSRSKSKNKENKSSSNKVGKTKITIRTSSSISSHRYMKFSEKIMFDDYMKTFIIQGSTAERCICIYCKNRDGEPLEIFVDNIEAHIQ